MEDIKICERCGARLPALPYISEDGETIICKKCYERETYGEVQVLGQCQDATSLTATQYIALELVKAWSGQMGQPAEFDSHIDNYLKAIEKLEERIYGKKF